MPKLTLKIFIAISITLVLIQPLSVAAVDTIDILSLINPLAAAGNTASAAVKAAGVGGGGSCGFLGIYCAFVNGFTTITNWITYAVVVLGGWLINIAAALIQILIGINRDILINPFVTAGFKITLSLANLGFVLALIIIAFATILRWERYGIKAMLRNLIVAAILVNFSLVIVGLFIDFTNSLAVYFIEQGAGGTTQFSDALANSFNLNKLTGNVPTAEQSAGIGMAFTAFINIFVSLLAVAIFTGVLVITFFTIAAMTFIRAIYLGVLIILMPLAWFAWIIPDLSGQWNKWWSSFIQWTLFLPIVSMFLYLSIAAPIAIGQQIGDLKPTGLSGKAAEAASAIGLLEPEYIKILLQIILQVGFVFGGLIAANKLGISGASTAMGMANTTKGWILGWGKRMAMAPVKVAGGAIITAGTRPTKASAHLLSNLLSSKVVSWVPGVKGAANRLAGFSQRKEEIAEYQKNNLSNLDDNQIKKQLKNPPMGTIAKSAIFTEASKRKLIPDSLKDMDEATKKELLTSYAGSLKNANPGIDIDKIPEIKELANIDPKLVAELINKSISEVVKKIDISKLAESLSVDYVKSNSGVVEAMDEVQLKTFKRVAKSKDQLDAVREQLEKATGNNLAKLNSTIRSLNLELQEAKKFGSDQEISTAKAELKQTMQAFGLERKRSSLEQKRAYDKLASFNQVIGESEIT